MIKEWIIQLNIYSFCGLDNSIKCAMEKILLFYTLYFIMKFNKKTGSGQRKFTVSSANAI